MKIGIIGGGQLALMMIQSSPEHEYIVLEPNKECSVKDFAQLIVAEYNDKTALHELNSRCDVITYEFENVPAEGLKIVENKLFPNSSTLFISQNRLREKNMARDLSIPTPIYFPINTVEDLERGLMILGGKGVLKTLEGGYDGKGQVVIKTLNVPNEAKELIKRQPCILEEFINFTRESSLIITRDRKGKMIYYPSTANVHRDQILRTTSNLDKVSQKKKVKAVERIVEKLDVVGTFTVEFLDTDYGFIFNEIAPRVHNSGHWTIEGTNCSQFRNHILAITGQSVIVPESTGYTIMINLIGSEFIRAKNMKLPKGCYFHDYLKQDVRPGRKMGHITVNTSSKDETRKIADWIFERLK